MNPTSPSTTSQSAAVPSAAGARKAKPWQRILPLLITAACFAYLYTRLNHAATAEGSSLLAYLAKSFEKVNWFEWLALMIPYCFFYLVFDSLVVWKVINWFNAKISYADILPIRASAYILSLVNEQVSKGAIAVYLNRRDGVPGWEVGSSMLLIMFCEIYSLILWATVGVLLRWNNFQPAFHAIPWIALGAAVFFTLFHLFFSGKIGPGIALRGGFARAARARRGGGIYAGIEAVWRLGRIWRDAGLFAGDILRRSDARADALGGDSFLGAAFPGSTRPDDRVRLRDAQFLHLL
jgi:hypothetical protein